MSREEVRIHMSDGRDLVLDPDQARCVTTTGQHQRIIAGPGSGKTTTMVGMCAYNISSGVSPEEIVITTFTNRAAAELQTRLIPLIGKDKTRRVWCGTFHGLALRFLRKYNQLPEDCTMWTSSTEMTRVFKDSLVQHNTAWAMHAKAVHKQYDLRRLRVDPEPAKPVKHGRTILVPASVVELVFQDYERYKEENRLLDFDDLMHKLLAFLRSPNADELHASIRFFIMDEMQDSNEMQTAIAHAFAENGTHVTAVGDDCQSIYAFRGSSIDHIHRFPTLFPGTVEYKLERNYRSTPQIADLCNRLIEHNTQRIPKVITSCKPAGSHPSLHHFDTAREELEFIGGICRDIPEEESCAVLFRTNRGVDAMQSVLSRHMIPFTVLKGKSLFEMPHVLLMIHLLEMCLFRWPSEVVVMPVLKMFPKVGPAVARMIWDEAIQHPSSFIEGLCNFDCSNLRSVREFVFLFSPLIPSFKMIHDGRGYEGRVGQIATAVSSHMKHYIPKLFKAHVRVDEYPMDIDTACALFKSFPKFQDFLDAAGLGECSTSSLTGKIYIGTIHQSKGLEFDTVVVAGCSTGSLPSPMSKTPLEIEEERRLLYVACSRARANLWLTYSTTGGNYAFGKDRSLTPFLTPCLPLLVGDVPPVSEMTGEMTVDELLEDFSDCYGRTNILLGLVTHAVTLEEMETDLLPAPVGRVTLMKAKKAEPLMQYWVSEFFEGRSVGEETSFVQLIASSDCGQALQIELRQSRWSEYFGRLEGVLEALLNGCGGNVDSRRFEVEVGKDCGEADRENLRGGVVTATFGGLTVGTTLLKVNYSEKPIGSRLLLRYVVEALLLKDVNTVGILDSKRGKLYRFPVPQLDVPHLDHPLGSLFR